METAHSTYFTATSPLVSVLFVPSLHSYYFSRKFLFFSIILCNCVQYVILMPIVYIQFGILIIIMHSKYNVNVIHCIHCLGF